MKIYTRTGDDGTTGLFGGQRVSKAAPRLAVIGAVDELNACIGFAQVVNEDDPARALLRAVQSRLFDIGAELSTPVEHKAIQHLGEDCCVDLETWIDRFSAELPELRNFILAGGCELAARLHLARTSCRAAERLCVALREQVSINPNVIIYLNRLSDLLFVMARRANRLAGVDDIPWKPNDQTGNA